MVNLVGLISGMTRLALNLKGFLKNLKDNPQKKKSQNL